MGKLRHDDRRVVGLGQKMIIVFCEKYVRHSLRKPLLKDDHHVCRLTVFAIALKKDTQLLMENVKRKIKSGKRQQQKNSMMTNRTF